MMHGPEKSDPAIVAVKPVNKAEQPRAEQSAAEPEAAEPVERRAGTKGNAGQQSTHRTQSRTNVSQALERIRKVASERKEERFTALFHHINTELLEEAFFELAQNAAPGVDQLTWKDYEADLERNIEDLQDRVQRGAYRALPSRRVYIPKPDGRQRPLAVAALEDKIVQRAVVALLNAIYEEDFLGFSYGFRPGRGTHDALDALCVGIHSKKVSFILDADIRSFFDEINQQWLIRFLEHRILKHWGEFAQLLGQISTQPAPALGDLVVGQSQSAFFRFAQACNDDDGNRDQPGALGDVVKMLEPVQQSFPTVTCPGCQKQ